MEKQMNEATITPQLVIMGKYLNRG